MCGRALAEWGADSKFPCAALREADVAVSTDNMSPRQDAAGGIGYTAGGTFNTGLVLIRATAAGMAFARAWHQIVRSATIAA